MTSKTTEDQPHLLLAIDFGSSLTKIFASLVGDKIEDVKPILMSPYCVEIGVQQIPPSNPKFDERSTWVKFQDAYYAVGNFAETNYATWVDIKSSKDDFAVIKTCGAIAVCRQIFNLPSTFKISIIALLPPGELAGKDDYKTDLVAALKNVETPAGRIKPKVQKIKVFSEGGGILSAYLNGYEQQNLKLLSLHDQEVAIIMSGFRNTSLLMSKQGQISKRITSPDGFYSFLSRIDGGYEPTSLIVPITRFLSDQKPDHLLHLIKSKKNSDRELHRLIKSVEQEHQNFIEKLTNWLDHSLPHVDTIICCGGTFNCIYKQMEEFLLTKLNNDEESLFHCQIREKLREFFLDVNMQSRMIDIYYAWANLYLEHHPDLDERNTDELLNHDWDEYISPQIIERIRGKSKFLDAVANL
jgi:hypothetical protein